MVVYIVSKYNEWTRSVDLCEVFSSHDKATTWVKNHVATYDDNDIRDFFITVWEVK